MTTGRINQVTTFLNHFCGPSLTRGVPGALSAFTTWSSSTFVHSRPTAACRHLPPRGYKRPQTRRWRHLVSRSHTSQARSPCPVERQRSPPLMRTTKRPATPERHATDVADPLVVSCIRIDHRQAIHLLRHRSNSHHIRMARGFKGEQRQPASQPPGPSSSSQPSHKAGLFDST
jgi:hypothetical protein